MPFIKTPLGERCCTVKPEPTQSHFCLQLKVNRNELHPICIVILLIEGKLMQTIGILFTLLFRHQQLLFPYFSCNASTNTLLLEVISISIAFINSLTKDQSALSSTAANFRGSVLVAALGSRTDVILVLISNETRFDEKESCNSPK